MFCKNCGVEIKEGAQFCSKCGAKVSQSNTVPQISAPKEKESNIEQLLKRVTKRQLTYIGIAALAIVIVFGVISSIRKSVKTNKVDSATVAQHEISDEDMYPIRLDLEDSDDSFTEPKSTEKNIQEYTLDEQLSLMGEYMDAGRVDKTEELLYIMVEQYLYEPELYLGVAGLMIERNHEDSAVDVLVTGYQYTKDEQIKNKLLDLQTRSKIGDEAADQIDRALGLAEDIADIAGYGDKVEKGKDIFNTIYGYYLDSK